MSLEIDTTFSACPLAIETHLLASLINSKNAESANPDRLKVGRERKINAEAEKRVISNLEGRERSLLIRHSQGRRI